VGFEKEVDQTIETLFPEIIYTPTIESFNKLAKQCGRFFSMRYHGLIGSLAFSSNVFATSDLKNKLLLEELGMINRYVNEDNLEDIINNPLLSHQDQKPLIERSRKLFIDSLQQILLKIN
jgi:polysaccharide pyruvyl transferase WcaK-like protein